jgi:hypothetical protein
MATPCQSTRCTKCGRKRRQLFEDPMYMEDIELMDIDILDALWSPLEPSKGRRGVQQSTSYSPSPASKTIVIDLVTPNPDTEDLAPRPRKRKSGRVQTNRNKAMGRVRHVSVSRLLQNFARGMASAFGTSVTSRPRKGGRRTYLNDFDLGDLKTSRTFLPGIFPAGSRIRYIFKRMGGLSVPSSPEHRPLAADYHDDPSPYYPVMPNSFRLRY